MRWGGWNGWNSWSRIGRARAQRMETSRGLNQRVANNFNLRRAVDVGEVFGCHRWSSHCL